MDEFELNAYIIMLESWMRNQLLIGDMDEDSYRNVREQVGSLLQSGASFSPDWPLWSIARDEWLGYQSSSEGQRQRDIVSKGQLIGDYILYNDKFYDAVRKVEVPTEIAVRKIQQEFSGAPTDRMTEYQQKTYELARQRESRAASAEGRGRSQWWQQYLDTQRERDISRQDVLRGEGIQQSQFAATLQERRRQFDVTQAKDPENERLRWELLIENLGKSPTDWIKQYRAQRAFEQRGQTDPSVQELREARVAGWQSRILGLGEELTAERGAINRFEGGLPDDEGADRLGEREFVESNLRVKDLQRQIKQAKNQQSVIEDQIEARKESDRNRRGGSPVAPIQWNPNAPAWLQRFVPGQTPGQEITPEFVPTPSPQQLNRATPTQLGQLRGFTEFAGGRSFEDLMNQARIQTPISPRGAGIERFRPIEQRA